MRFPQFISTSFPILSLRLEIELNPVEKVFLFILKAFIFSFKSVLIVEEDILSDLAILLKFISCEARVQWMEIVHVPLNKSSF